MKIIQVLGTSSGAGKSTVAMALCRIFSDMGMKVSPFKAVNMSLNSVALPDGSEISRAQYVQAIAARNDPSKFINPILLKPEGGISSQVIVLGRSKGKMDIPVYYEFIKGEGTDIIKDSLKKLADTNDIVIAEGAGSPAEINLLDRDYANIFISKIFNTPALLVADIERGGSFACLYGTLKLMPSSNLVKWMLINRMRGDRSLIFSGIKKIEAMTEKKVIGVLP
ncbi:MAG: cobyric acid synthase, partial [Thermoplasmata archaeon]